MDLRQQIKSYYFDHFDELSKDKQFHFASRLATWQSDARAKNALNDLKPHMTLKGDYKTALKNLLNEPVGSVFAKRLRMPYFEKYPQLYGIHNAFFRIRHLKELYGIDIRNVFLDMISQKELTELYERLMHDPGAIRILSRFAVDYLYLYDILFDQQIKIDPSIFLYEVDKYDLEDAVQKHLFIYLYTHCIIAESNFYTRKIPAERINPYSDMLKEIEKVIEGPDIKLDNKFEFLVACRICNYRTELDSVINKEAANSLSPQGRFIIDKLNSDFGRLNSFEGSEHRNVLFIMSGSIYEPQSALSK